MIDTPARTQVAVIGGGISGLATAFWLSRRDIAVLLLEARSRAGGTIETVRERGYLIELGPNSALNTTPLIGELAGQLGIAGELIFASDAARDRFILRDGRLQPVPLSPVGFLRSRLFSAGAKLRLLREPFIARGNDPEETIAAFVERRLGREFLDYAINPFVAGVYAGDPGLLSVAAAFPRLHRLEQRYGGVLKGAVAGKRERARRAKRGEVAKQAAKLFSFRTGLQALTDAMAQKLGERILLESPVQSIQPAGQGWKITFTREGGSKQVMADAVVIAAPADVAGRLIADLDGSLANELAAVHYPPVSMVFLGYEARAVARRLDGFGFLVPQVEGRSILGTIWSSTLFEERAPEGHVSFTTFIGGSRQPEMALRPESGLVETTCRELADILGITGEPAFVRVKRWKRAIPQYTTGYGAFLQRLETFEKRFPGLRFCANFTGGISIADCIQSANRTVSAIEDYFPR